MKFRVKFKTDPQLDKCLKEMQAIKDYMCEKSFIEKMESAFFNRLEDDDDNDIFKIRMPLGGEASLGCVIRDLHTLVLNFVDFKNKKLDLTDSMFFSHTDTAIDIFFNHDVWSDMPEGELKDKILYWCEHCKDKLCNEFDRGNVKLPDKAYENGYLTIEFNMDRLPEVGSLDECLTQENGSTVVKLDGNDDKINIINCVDNFDFDYDFFDFDVLNSMGLFSNIVNIINRAGIDFDKLEDGETVVAETYIVNNDGYKLQDVNFKEIENTETGERCLKLKLPGGKKYYDIDLNLRFRNNLLRYKVEIAVDIKSELADSIEKYFNFIKKVKEINHDAVERRELDLQLEALSHDYSSWECIRNLYSESAIYDSDYKAITIDAVLGEEEKVKIERYPEVLNCEYNDVHEGIWMFKGVIIGWTVEDMKKFKKIVEMRVAKHPVKLNYTKVTE